MTCTQNFVVFLLVCTGVFWVFACTPGDNVAWLGVLVFVRVSGWVFTMAFGLVFARVFISVFGWDLQILQHHPLA